MRGQEDSNAGVGSRPLRWIRRLRNHAALGGVTLAVATLLFVAIPSADAVFRASMATAYVGLALLAATLAFGSVAAFRGRRYPVTTDIRRDVGIWTAIYALVHVVIGLQVHLRGKMWEYFVHSVRGSFLPRIDPFGAANYAGAIAALLLAMLLVTSNDASLRKLGALKWQRVHRLVEWALVLTLLHGGAYQWLEKRHWVIVVGFVVVAVTVIGARVRAGRVRRNR